MSFRILPQRLGAGICRLEMPEFKNTASVAWCQQSAGRKCMSLRILPQRLGASNLQAGNA
jgi:hypothetical protein